jgi:methionine-rich copper-binding protein CopC
VEQKRKRGSSGGAKLKPVHVRKLTAAFGIAVLSGSSVLLFSGTGMAHAAYEYSEPNDGDKVSSPPAEVMANYTEPLSEGSYLKVYDPCGDKVDSGDVRIFNDEMTVSMEGDKSGSYRVDWLAISDIDPHSTRGSFTFTATSGETCPRAAGASTKQRGTRTKQKPMTRRGGSNDDLEGSGVGAKSNDRARAAQDSGDTEVDDAGAPGGARDRELSNPNLAVRRTDEAAGEPGVFDLPWGKVVIAWLVAAAIGAVGGLIYDGIMGPRSE